MSETHGAARNVIFLHIPKAAGTSVSAVLRKVYRGSQAYDLNGSQADLKRFLELPVEKRARIRLLTGHMRYGLHRYLEGPSTYVTILREPVARLVSLYHFVLQNPGHYLYEPVVSRNLSFQEFVTSGLTVETDNNQIRHLAGDDELIDFGGCTKELLQRARTNIEHSFAVVGFAERFAESLVLMKAELGWRSIPFYVRKNEGLVRPAHDAISEETRALVRESNALDCQFYDWACERFEASLVSIEEELDRELPRLRRHAVISRPAARMSKWTRKAKGLVRGYLRSRGSSVSSCRD